MLKHRGLLLTKYLISIGVLALILWRSDLNSFLAAFKEVNVSFYGAGLLVTAFNILVRSYKWHLLLKVQGANVSLLKIQNLSYMSLFYNNFFLGSIGGDAFRIYKTLGYSNSKGGAASAVIMERATGLVMGLLLVLAIGGGLVFEIRTFVTINQLATLLLIGLIAGLAFYVILTFSGQLTNSTILDNMPKFKIVAEELIAGIQLYRSHHMTILLTLILSLLYHIGNSVAVYYFTLAATAGVSLIHLLIITPLVALLVMIPISINGLGVQEGSYVFFLTKIGVTGHIALIVAVLARLTLLIFSLIGGLLLLIHSRQIRQHYGIAERSTS